MIVKNWSFITLWRTMTSIRPPRIRLIVLWLALRDLALSFLTSTSFIRYAPLPDLLVPPNNLSNRVIVNCLLDPLYYLLLSVLKLAGF